MNGEQLRAKMHGGERIYGTMTSFVRNPRWANIYSNIGLDYVIVDSEHSPAGRAEGADLAMAFLGAGICPILRVPTTEPAETVKGLDAGFHGVLVPYCEEADEVRRVVQAARLRPLKGALHDRVRDGEATLNDETRAYLDKRNADRVILIGIESEVALNNLEQILDVGGFDGIFIGPNDLSITLGVPDQYEHPRFVEAVEYIISTSQQRGLPAGGHWFSEKLVEYWMDRGSRFILFYNDGRALIEGYRAIARFRNVPVKEMAYNLGETRS